MGCDPVMKLKIVKTWLPVERPWLALAGLFLSFLAQMAKTERNKRSNK